MLRLRRKNLAKKGKKIVKVTKNPFPCTKCAACCIVPGKLGIVPQREDGACLYLTEDNLCSIYDDRPDMCRIKSTDDYTVVKNLCDKLQDDFGMDHKYRVSLDN